MKSIMKRRQFLQIASANLLLGLMPIGKVHAAGWGNDDWDGFFVSVHFDGAWDISLSLDPWILPQMPDAKDMFIEYRNDELIKLSSDILVGPTMSSMKDHAGDFAIVNGVFMSPTDNGHSALADFAFSGDTRGHYGALAVEISQSIAPHVFTILSNDSSLNTGPRNFKIVDIGQAKNLIGGASAGDMALLSDDATIGILLQAKLANDNGAKFAQANDAHSKIMQNPQASQFDDFATMAAAFSTGLASTAHYRVDPSSGGAGLDTHSDHPVNHMKGLASCWQQLDALFKIFKSTEYKNGKSLFDNTTFYVTSEFSRTPALNQAKGKDHNPWSNSALLAGRGIKGGQILGASSLVKAADSTMGIPYVVGMPIDLSTNKVIDARANVTGSTVINPQNLMRTLIHASGIDEKALGENLSKVSILNSVLRSQS